MSIRKKRTITALAIGTVATLVLCGLGFAFAESNVELSYKLYWQGLILQDLVPCVQLAGVDLCKSIPLNAFLFWVGIPLGIALYSALAYGVLALIWRDPATPPR